MNHETQTEDTRKFGTIAEALDYCGWTLEEVGKIYRGKDNECRCGCHGTYHEDPNSRGFRMAINQIKRGDFKRCEVYPTARGFINIPYGPADKDMCLTIYLKEVA